MEIWSLVFVYIVCRVSVLWFILALYIRIEMGALYIVYKVYVYYLFIKRENYR